MTDPILQLSSETVNKLVDLAGDMMDRIHRMEREIMREIAPWVMKSLTKSTELMRERKEEEAIDLIDTRVVSSAFILIGFKLLASGPRLNLEKDLNGDLQSAVLLSRLCLAALNGEDPTDFLDRFLPDHHEKYDDPANLKRILDRLDEVHARRVVKGGNGAAEAEG